MARTDCTCEQCGYKARGKNKLNLHLATHLKCRMCHKTFSSSTEASEHEVHCTKSLPRSGKRCALCSAQCPSIEDMEKHLLLDHDITIESDTLDFECQEDFHDWKKEIEASSKTRFVRRTFSTRSNKEVAYLHCHRDGYANVKPEDSRVRLLRKRGPNKMNACCPARMHVTSYNDGRVIVKYVSTHVGHDFFLERLDLDKNYRAELAAKMIQKIPLDEVLDAEREKFQIIAGENGKEAESVELTRSNILTRKDLHNIARDFRVKKEVKEIETEAMPEELPRKRLPVRSLEDFKARMLDLMETVTNEKQLDALYEALKYAEALLPTLAVEPSTTEESHTIPLLPHQPSASKKIKLAPQRRFLVIHKVQKKKRDTLSTPSEE